LTHLVYDNSFEGFLTAIFITFSHSYQEVIISSQSSYLPTLFGEEVTIYTDLAQAKRVLTKIETFFNRMRLYMPFLRDYHFVVRSHNSFPHSSGIASSASAMAALAVCLMKIEKLFCPEMTDEFFYEKASFLARLGSGSACRSNKLCLVVGNIGNGING